jgi:translation initiation factor IF-3
MPNSYELRFLSGCKSVHFFNEILEVSTIAQREKDLFINKQIRAKEVMVIGPGGEQLGLKQIADALTLAEYAGFDLVLMNNNAKPPVCKIMDYNKHKYESKKRAKENQKKQRESNLDLKEYRLSVTIDVHDFNTRVKNATKYLEKGHKVKAQIRFKGRELAHTNLGRDVLNRFADATKEIAEVEQSPKLDGRFMTMILKKKDK